MSEDESPKNSMVHIILIGVFLTSLSSLMLEVTITRIFSVTIWYHYAFVAVSVALLGWSFGGVFVHFLDKKLKTKALFFTFAGTSLFSLAIPLYLWTIVRFPMPISFLIIYYSISTIPFFFGGFSLALLFNSFAGSANKIYFADLVGASLGCLLVEPALTLFGAETSVLLLGVTASVAAIFFAFACGKRKLVAFSLITLIVTSSIFVNNVYFSSISIRNAPSKGLYQGLQDLPQLRLVSTKWNSFSRVDVVEGPDPPLLAHIFIDADAMTNVLRWDGNLDNVQFLKDTVGFLPYYILNEPNNTLIIGSGGGVDIVTALVGGSLRIVAVEINPLIVEATKKYGNLAGNVYIYDGVELVIDEGRSFITRSDEKFDVIVLVLVDSWAAITAGGYALAENYLYTTEAFNQYFEHLTDNGFLAMVRWAGEIPKLVSTSIVTLENKGIPVTEASKHLAIVTWEYEPGKIVVLFLLKKTPFTLEEAQMLHNRVLSLGPNYKPFHIPYLHSEEPYSQLFNGTFTLDQFYKAFNYKIEPATDDSPYYFCFENPIPQSLSNLITWASFIALSLAFVPLIANKRYSKMKIESVVPFVMYFAALGLAFMLLEVALIQKFILFLGYPTRALSVVLFTLLLSSGIGSFFSGLIKKDNRKRIIRLACSLIIGVAIIYTIFLEPLFTALLPQDTLIRVLVTFLLVFPLGFFMGMPFPTGISFLSSESDTTSVPWMWAVNGAMSVLGSILATATGIVLGLSYAIIFAALLYFVAFLSTFQWAS